MIGKISRRLFLALTGGSGAALVMKPGEQFVEKLIPYVNPPKYPKPGEWAYYITTCRECPAGCGLLMWHRDGRVTKADGNPFHPVNKGKICIRGQSSVQGLYDPDRLREVLTRNKKGELVKTSRENALHEIRTLLKAGKRPALISGVESGSLKQVIENFVSGYGGKKPLWYEALNYESMRKAYGEIAGKEVIPKYNIEGCDIVVSAGAPFLETWISPVEYARHFGDIHSLKEDKDIGKFVYIGSAESMTSASADEKIFVGPVMESEVLLYIAARVISLKPSEKIKKYRELLAAADIEDEEIRKKADKIAEALAYAKDPIVLAGKPEDASETGKRTVIASVILNDILGSSGRINYDNYHAVSASAYKNDVKKFFEFLTENDILFIHDANPAYSEPYLKEYLKKPAKVVFLGTLMNETAEFADYILPINYYLENWGDYEPYKGFISLMQPTMRPLFETLSAGEIFMRLSDYPGNKDSNNNIDPFKLFVRNNWVQHNYSETSDDFFKEALQLGYIKSEQKVEVRENLKLQETSITPPQDGKLPEKTFYLDAASSLFFYDGRLTNRSWLQEIPHPVSNIPWQSWVDLNADTAKHLGIEEEDIVVLSNENGEIRLPARLSYSVAENIARVELGRGHALLGRNASGKGENVYRLLNGDGSSPKVKIAGTGEKFNILYLHPTKDQRERELLRHEKYENITNGAAKKEKLIKPLPEGYNEERDLYNPHEHKDHRWGMAIDLQKCIGCKACEAACYAENNIPVMGEARLKEGREMSWLKIIPYEIDKNNFAFMPLPCQHCDAAPCEPVCPVFASVHTEEGLNAQIYNRCIGTRYCSNNCPYKVRRFNWSNVEHEYPLNMQYNPEVTVRERGVMEKCTFCVQRIRNAEYKAKRELRPIKDGEIKTACQQTCPTDAIIFGDILEKKSEVSRLYEDERRYQALQEFNTKPAVVYLKKIKIDL